MTPPSKAAAQEENAWGCRGARIFPERFLPKLLLGSTQTPARPPTDHREPTTS